MFDILRSKKDMTLNLLNKEHLYEKHAENVHQKLLPDPFLILVNNPKQKFFYKSDILKVNL